MLADEQITHEDYREMVEVNNTEIEGLVKQKNELLTSLENEHVIENIEKLKHELLNFLKFDELTPEVLHRLIDKIEIKEDGTPRINYRFSAPQLK